MIFPLLLIVIIALALVFDFINGFHDAANSIATIVSTKVLTPFQAVLWAAFWNFAAFFLASYFFGFGIGNSVAKTVTEDYITLEVIFSGLVAAVAWNLITWWFGIPSSSSHTLIGGFIGAALMHAFLQSYHEISAHSTAGFMANVGASFMDLFSHKVVKFDVVIPIFLFIFLAPFIGMIISIIVTTIIVNLCKKMNPHKADNLFKKLQLVSSALFSLGHGTNDSQKVMGIIGAAVIFFHLKLTNNPNDPFALMPADQRFDFFAKHYLWVPFASFLAMGLGTMSGGWKIVKTMGTRITKVTPLEGVAAETAGAITLFITEHFKIPVSTTHTITGSIIGVGLTKRVSAVRWGITINLLWAWILTIPISALIAGTVYFCTTFFNYS